MKKYFPILFFITVFAAFLVGQVALDLLDIKARFTPKEEQVRTYYESIFFRMELKTNKDEEINLREVSAPIVILNFWASWCLPCLEEFPSMVEMKKKFSDEQVLVVGINSDEEEQKKKIIKIEKKYGLNFHQVTQKSSEIFGEFMVTSIPTSLVFHRGNLVDVYRGGKDFNSDEFIKTLEKLLRSD